jgi:hypothetical protein
MIKEETRRSNNLKVFVVACLISRLKGYFREINRITTMYWTLELASYLDDAPWPATKDELIDYAIRSGAPLEVIENLQELEDDEL